MSRKIVFGEIQGIGEGYVFEDRKSMMPISFHRNWGAGIDGNAKEGAAAIVLSGGYEDDVDFGDEIIYTGAGGNNPGTKKQVEDQTWENKGNAALLTSMNKGLPVRVIRGFKHQSKFSPKKGYQYAGLYSVVDAWIVDGKNRFKICRFRLVYSGENINRIVSEEIELNNTSKLKQRRQGVVLRIVRDTKMAHEVKRLYDYKCQVCELSIPTKSGKYAEGAHIKPLGKPHDGDDTANNLLCLCPNHHVMFDRGAFSIADDLSIVGALSGKLVLHVKHILNQHNLHYHRQIHGYR